MKIRARNHSFSLYCGQNKHPMIVPLQYKYMYHHSNTSMTSLAAQATLLASPAISYFVILCAAWLLHPAFLQDRKTPYFLPYQVSNFQTIPSFPSTLSFSTLTKLISLPTLNNPTITRSTRSNCNNKNSTSSTKPAVSSSGTSKVNTKKLTTKPEKLTQLSMVTKMILDSGLHANAFFVVRPKESDLANGFS